MGPLHPIYIFIHSLIPNTIPIQIEATPRPSEWNEIYVYACIFIGYVCGVKFVLLLVTLGFTSIRIIQMHTDIFKKKTPPLVVYVPPLN